MTAESEYINETFESLYQRLPGNGWLTKNEARLLFMRSVEAEGNILEIGSHHGRSTVLLACVCEETVYAIDPFTNFDSDDHEGIIAYNAFLNNLKDRHINNVTLLKNRVEDVDPKVVPLIGFAYLDGDHTNLGTWTQIRFAIAAGARNFCIHDYANSGEGLEVKRAIESTRLKVIEVVERMAYCEV